MSDYLFIQSQDPFTEARTASQYQLAIQLAQAGKRVSVLLVQNGVSPARRNAVSPEFEELLNSPVSVLADEFALQQREIGADQLQAQVQVCELDTVIDALSAGHKVIWN